jgi:alkylhydroperoxidase family enzyme
MTSFIAPPMRIPFYLRWGLRIAQRKSRTELLPAQLLTWYPRAAIGSAVLEALIAHNDGRLHPRTLKLVRMAVSHTVSCPFCIGMNSAGWEKFMTNDEREAVQGLSSLDGFSAQERLAIEFARKVSETPLAITDEFGAELRTTFSEREIVVLATTAAQVNYWARTIQALGCPPE